MNNPDNKPEPKKKEQIAEEQPLAYTDMEVGGIMHVLGQVYALDDAIYNQEQLRRPETYIKPLRELRSNVAGHLVNLTSKGRPPSPDPEPNQ